MEKNREGPLEEAGEGDLDEGNVAKKETLSID